MATYSSILAWKILWTEEPGMLQSMRSQSQTRLSDFTFRSHPRTSSQTEGGAVGLGAGQATLSRPH